MRLIKWPFNYLLKHAFGEPKSQHVVKYCFLLSREPLVYMMRNCIEAMNICTK